MEWIVRNAVSRDVERQHLNKILKEIRSAVSSTSGDSLSEEQIRQIIQQAISSIPSPQINSFNIKLEGDVEGEATVAHLTDTTIPTTLSKNYVEEAPTDSNIYWRTGGQWQAVPGTLRSLSVLDGEGLVVYSEEDGWVVREVEGIAGEIVVTDGDGVDGNPTIGLEDVTPTADGELKKYGFDSKGRRVEEDDATTDDLAEGVINLYFTEERAREAISDGLVDAIDDAAAAGLGVPVGGFYRNGSVLMIRTV